MGAVLHALSITGSMTWEITWALILGFALSAVIQAVVRRSTIAALLGGARPRTLVIAAGLGASLALLMGWQFTLAECAGGPVMIVVVAVAFRLFLRGDLLTRAREQA